MIGFKLSVEELRDYCNRLCHEGKGGNRVMIGGSNMGAGNVSPYNSDDVTWWEADKIGYNDGELRILATSVDEEHRILKSDVRDMALHIDGALDGLRAGDIRSLEENINIMQDRIDTLLAEVS